MKCIYELRSYESHTEAIAKNKIEMFNKGDEIGLFNRLGFNAVFYGEVITGSRMPNLMYLTTFENKVEEMHTGKNCRESQITKTMFQKMTQSFYSLPIIPTFNT